AGLHETYTTRFGPNAKSCPKNRSSEPRRGGSIITAVSSAGNSIPSKIVDASPARNSQFPIPFNSAFSRAHLIDASLISTPAAAANRPLAVKQNNPDPQYASTKNRHPSRRASSATYSVNRSKI